MLSACGNESITGSNDKGAGKGAGVGEEEATEEIAGKSEVMILAAASLTDVCGELEPLFEKEHPDVDLIFSFGSSGALQSQIEEGAPADIFLSASLKQMDALKDEGLMDDESITELLENKVVLIVPKGNPAGISSFEDCAEAKAGIIGLGDPESVPAGQYAEEVFSSLGIWDTVRAKANCGSDVRTVLAWAETGDIDCGVVYATDALTTDKVETVAQAPEGSCKKIIYPAGIVKASGNKKAAEAFLEFLKGDEAKKVFESYGF